MPVRPAPDFCASNLIVLEVINVILELELNTALEELSVACQIKTRHRRHWLQLARRSAAVPFYLRKQNNCVRLGPIRECRSVKKLVPVAALSQNSLLCHVDDNQARGGLLPGEIPGILNICVDCEPMARCPVDFYAASLS
jgi:hypothetical protein